MANFDRVIKLAIALIIIAVIFPIALGLLGAAGDIVISGTNITVGGADRTLSQIIDPTVLTLLVVLVPIIAIISVVMMFLPKGKSA